MKSPSVDEQYKKLLRDRKRQAKYMTLVDKLARHIMNAEADEWDKITGEPGNGCRWEDIPDSDGYGYGYRNRKQAYHYARLSLKFLRKEGKLK